MNLYINTRKMSTTKESSLSDANTVTTTVTATFTATNASHSLIHTFNDTNSENNSNNIINNTSDDDLTISGISSANVIIVGDKIVTNGNVVIEHSQHENQMLIVKNQQQLHEQQDIPATDSGRASVNEFDTTLEENSILPLTVLEIANENERHVQVHGGILINAAAAAVKTTKTSEMENLKNMNIPTTAASIHAGNEYCCTEDFYASSGSQTKWYLRPTEICANNSTCLATSPTQSNVPVNNVVIIPASSSTDTITTPIPTKEANAVVGNVFDDKILPKATNPKALPADDVNNSFTTNLSHQMRAVSSPSLTDTLQEEENIVTTSAVVQNSLTFSSCVSGESTSAMVTVKSNSSNDNSRSMGLPNSHSVGVLQKFKRTLTNFNKSSQQQQQQQHIVNNSTTQALVLSGTTTTANTANIGEIETNHSEAATNYMLEGTMGKYRFGPLIWRSSKERRKTKYNRRDKCNSGDSGIQIELDNDEQFSRILASANIGGSGVSVASTSAAAEIQHNTNDKVKLKTRSIRRVNSAKATNTTADIATAKGAATLNAKAKVLKRMDIYDGSMERAPPESLPARSLSQPNGLDTCGIRRNGELDDSDSDSVTSYEEVSNSYPLYAEVLYSFSAAGPQELGLERGTLIEVLRKEVGPWWFGRIRKDENNTLVEEILDPELGWFPKDFVRIIQCPKTDDFFLSQMESTTTAMRPNLSTTTIQPLNCKKNTKISTTTTQNMICTKEAQTLMPNIVNQAATAPIVISEDLDATIVDENNVTTIVVESPSYSSLMNANAPNINIDSNSVCADGSNALAPSNSNNVILDSSDILRRNAVKELLDTEINYVRLLAAICEGYLPAMSKRIDIFSPNSIRLIFSNITAIYKFQRKFLEALRKGIEQNQVAKVFLKMHKGFLCYSTYCNSYSRALIELETYERVKDARTILDNCRESENLAELPLSAHLLAPVQRICRYPLHLSEILKGAQKCGEAPEFELAQYEQFDVSQMDITDTYEKIDLALEAMRGITEAVNEGKRHSETIARHQASFQNFKGPPLHLHSTRFFLQIDATRQKQNLWNSSCTLFLFDNQLVYCKRDIIKRSQFMYKGRIFLDRCRVVNVRDGKMFGHTIRNSLRIYCEARDKWYDFSFRSANRKHRFLSTLALERQFGGKAFYIAEMTGFEYAYDERDYSDQSDYELPDCEQSNSSSGGGGFVVGVGGLASATRHWSMADVSIANTAGVGTSATSGDSSVPESPVKYKYSDTLPKKSQTRDGNATSGAVVNENQTGSLGRRRLGNWFRKPKSSNSTPNHSPTHKASDLPTAVLVGGSENNIAINMGGGNYISSGSSA